MASEKKVVESVDEYIGSFPKEVQKILRSVQKAIATAVPSAEEKISYQMPAFNHNGWIFYYSAYKDHYSLSCPPPFTVFAEFKTELEPYVVSKSAIKFPFDKPVPTKLISAMAAFRAKENKTRVAKKKAA